MAQLKLKGQVPLASTAFCSEGEVRNGNTPSQSTGWGFRRTLVITSSSGKRNGRHRHTFIAGTTVLLWGRVKRKWTHNTEEGNAIIWWFRKKQNIESCAKRILETEKWILVCSSIRRRKNKQRCNGLACLLLCIFVSDKVKQFISGSVGEEVVKFKFPTRQRSAVPGHRVKRGVIFGPRASRRQSCPLSWEHPRGEALVTEKFESSWALQPESTEDSQPTPGRQHPSRIYCFASVASHNDGTKVGDNFFSPFLGGPKSSSVKALIASLSLLVLTKAKSQVHNMASSGQSTFWARAMRDV